MGRIYFFNYGLQKFLFFVFLMLLTGCGYDSNTKKNSEMVVFDTTDVQNTYLIFSKYPKETSDSLYRSLFLSLSHSGKINLLEQHLKEYRKLDLNSKTNKAIFHLYNGLIVLKRSAYDSAITYLDSALIEINADNYPKEYLLALKTKAICYSSKGVYDMAIGLRYQTLLLYEKMQDTVGKFQEFGELGIVLFLAHDFKRANVLIDSSLTYFKNSKNDSLEAYFLSSKSVMLFSKQKFDSAIVIARRSLDLRSKNGDIEGQAESYNNLALAYMGKNEWDIAKGYLHHSYILYQLLKNERQIPIILQNIATCYDKLNMLDSSLIKINESYLLAQQKGQLEEEKVALRMLTSFYKRKGDFEKSFEYYHLFNKLKDSLYSMQKQKTIEELSMKYETSKKEEHIKLLEKDRRIQLQKNWLLVSLLIASALLGGGIMLLLTFRNKKNRELFQSQEKLRETELMRMKNELDFNKKELESFMLNLIEKTKLIGDLENKLESFSAATETRNPYFEKNISELTQMKILTEENWSQFKNHFERAYPGMIQQVKESFDHLSPAELRMFLLMKLNIDSKEIASILGISIESVKKTRYRLKKKMELTEEEDLNDFVRNY